jgi:sugar O-acyltransferase (sialic acid O-acetyltransferase NeuD family)
MSEPNNESPENAVIIFGAGGQGKTLVDLLRALGSCPIAGFVDDSHPPGSRILDVPVLGGASILPALRQRGLHLAVNAVGGIGNVDVRLRVFDLLRQAGFDFPTVIHPSAVIEPSAEIQSGVQILPLSYIGSAARVGFGTLINAHVVVSHDCRIGQVVNLSPGALLAGGVTVEDYAQIGMGATINLNLSVGMRARVGNSAVVKADVPAGGRVYAGAIWPPRGG